MGAQKTPVKRFLATLNGVYQAHHRYKHITLTGDEYYIFLGGSFDINRHDWSGEWFLISRDTTGIVPNIGIIRDHAGPPPPTPPIVSPNGDLSVFTRYARRYGLLLSLTWRARQQQR
ncbi:MAG: hypothetical protein IPN33_25455 [Saprospiraceae bacterium]|nr:hypothetical protein [Saprospiraceae bacterium]